MKKAFRRTALITVFVAAALAVMPEVTLKYPEVDSQGLPAPVIKGLHDFMDQNSEEALRAWRAALISEVSDPAERARVLAVVRRRAGLDTLNDVTDLRVGNILTRLQARLNAVFPEEEAATIYTTCETAIKGGTPVELDPE